MCEAGKVKGSGLRKAFWVFCMVLLVLAFGVPQQRCLAADQPGIPTPEQKKAVEAALGTFAKGIAEQPLTSETAYERLTSYLKAHPGILGAAVAFAPVTKDGRVLKTAPYVYVQNGQYLKKDLASAGDYLTEEWYAQPAKSKKPHWSKPYFDSLGAQKNMITYSIPVYLGNSPQKSLVIVTSDLVIK